jgi:basic membrane protein A
LVKQALLGSFPGGGIHYGTLENEGVGLAPYHDLAGQIPDELDQAVQAVIAGIIAGEIGTGWPVP